MKCMFCQHEMNKLNPAATGKTSAGIYECYYCPRSVRFFYTGEEMDGYIIFVNQKDKKLNDHLYAVVFNLKEDTAGLYPVDNWRSSGPSYWEGYRMDSPLATFGRIPNITPANIHEKLKLYMIFT